MITKSPEPPAWLEPLSEREISILRLIRDGYSNREIAQRLALAPETVKWYNKQLFGKLGAGSRTEAVALAQAYGLLDEPGSLAAPEKPPSNLPAQLTSFVGRRKELDELRSLLKANRLVTLTGPGGTGKTRLALEAAGTLVEGYQDGVWLAELGPIRSPDFVMDTLAQILGIIRSGEAPLLDIIKHNLKGKHLLLVLDNFEHLLPAAPQVGELLAACPRLSVLATSRARLGLYGEQEYGVQPLSLPDLQQAQLPAQLEQSEAVSLFLQRVRAVQPNLVLDEAGLQAAAQICTRLEGLPLAIELAATQAKIFSLEKLSERLQEHIADQLSLLPGGGRNLRATISWSYNLLTPAENQLFARLAVFTGGGILEAVEQVCGGGLPLPVVTLLGALVDKNMVRVQMGSDGEPRFGMLETIREYAAERLAEAAPDVDIFSRYAAYYTHLCEQAAPEFRTHRQVYWFNRLRAEQENLRQVLAWSLAGPEINYGLTIVGMLRDFWYYTGYAAEGRRWAQQALAVMEGADPALQAGVCNTVAEIGYVLGDMGTAKQLSHKALYLYEATGDRRKTAWMQLFVGSHHIERPEEIPLGYTYTRRGLATLTELDDKPGMVMGLNVLGELARLEGDYAQAKQYYEDSLALVHVTGEELRVAMLYENLSFIAYRFGEYRNALEMMKEALTMVRAMRNDYGIGTFVACMAGPIAKLGDPQRATMLLGASIAVLESIQLYGHQLADDVEINEYIAECRRQLGEEAYQAALLEGAELTIPQVIELALGAG